jgi:hypothetical protein
MSRGFLIFFQPARRVVLAGFVLLAVSCRSHSPLEKPAESCDFSPVTGRVQGWVDRGYYPGAAVLVAKGNQVIYEKCFGDHTPDTQEQIASSGKWLAAAAIMSLVDEGKLSLADHPSKWLPKFKNDPKDQATSGNCFRTRPVIRHISRREIRWINTRRWLNPWRTFCRCHRHIRRANGLITAALRCRLPDAWRKWRLDRIGKPFFRSASRNLAG